MALRRERGTGDRATARGGARPLALVTLLYLVAAIVASLPAVLELPHAFIADVERPAHDAPVAGDHLQVAYRFWLAGDQAIHGRAPWLDPYSFQPLVEPQAVLMGWPWAAAYYPLHVVAGPVVAWNLLLLTSIVLAGLVTFLWLRRLALPGLAAFLGGLAFAIAPYRLAQSGAGHLLGWQAILIPLCLYAFERARAAPPGRSGHAWGLLAAIALLSIPASGQVHLALAALPFCLAYAAIRYEPRGTAWLVAGALAAVAAGLVIRETIIAGSIAADGRSLAQVEIFQSDPLDLISRIRRGGLEPFAYVGWLLPVAALVGMALLARGGRRGLAVLLLVSTVVPLLIALGTNLPGYEALRDVFPPLRFPRVPGRLLPVANLALAAAAAVAVARLLDHAPARRRTAVAALAVAFCLADLLVLPFSAAERGVASPAHASLADAAPGRYLDLPYLTPGSHFGAAYDLESIRARRERVGGYSSLAPPSAYRYTEQLRRLNCGIWLPGDDELIADLGVRFFALHRGMYLQTGTPGGWFAWEALQARGYRTAPGDGPSWLFERLAAPATSNPFREPERRRAVYCEAWRGSATTETRAGLWVRGAGTASLSLLADPAVPARVLVDGEPVAAVELGSRQTVRVPLDGDRWHAIVVEVPDRADRPGTVWLPRITLARSGS